jgi:hypothetical protein
VTAYTVGLFIQMNSSSKPIGQVTVEDAVMRKYGAGVRYMYKEKHLPFPQNYILGKRLILNNLNGLLL